MTSSLVALLLLLAGVEPNPGPSIKCGLINNRSIVRKGPLIQDLIETNDLDLLAVTETLIVNDDPNAIKLDSVPIGYQVVRVPRPHATRHSRVGGLCIIYSDLMQVKPLKIASSNSFECQLVKLTCSRSKFARRHQYCSNLSTASKDNN